MQSGSNPGMGSGASPGFLQFLSGMFGNSGSPYQAAMGPYQQWMQQAAGAQNPFLQAGQGAIGNYQNWAQNMQDPTKFMNNMMSQYQQSPYAQFEQQQGMRAANNMGSATGMTGSTPLQMQAQQNAQNISGQDMNNWMQNVLGVNQQYGQSQQNLMNMGQGAANQLTNLYGQEAQGMGNLAYGQQQGQNQDFSNMIGGFANMAPGLLSMFGM